MIEMIQVTNYIFKWVLKLAFVLSVGSILFIKSMLLTFSFCLIEKKNIHINKLLKDFWIINDYMINSVCTWTTN